jgi:membrane protease subunit (stomatin/prohibitin family)
MILIFLKELDYNKETFFSFYNLKKNLTNTKLIIMKAPFIEIIESTTPDPNLLMWKYVDEDQEIKNGAKLTVRETQHAMFLNEGQLADVFGPGMHKLSIENIPLLSRLKGLKYSFESSFKVDIYFFNTT